MNIHMKFLRFTVMLLSAISLAVSCKEDNGPITVPEAEDILELEFSEKVIDYTINEFAISVRANCRWEVSCSEPWVSITPEQESYMNSVLLHLRVQNNPDTESRRAEVTFHYGQDSTILVIRQEAFNVYLYASETNLDFGYRAAEKVIKINSNCGWYAKADAGWIAIKPSTGLIGDFDMLITVETNKGLESRDGAIRIWNETYGKEISVLISQSGKPADSVKNYIDEKGIDWGPGVEINGLTWATVNCGYETAGYCYGKMFQWGRKQGISYIGEQYKDTGELFVTDIWNGENGCESADTFYKAREDSRFGYDWIMEGDDSFWNLGTEEDPMKNTQFDPCPEGWRVPTSYEFRQLCESGIKEWGEAEGVYGYWFKESVDSQEEIFLPAGGRINISDGTGYDRNIEGYYWTISCSEAGSSAYLYFHSTHCTVNKQGSRAGGCLIRCIQE
jgi:uncharacterized protein (TIGR02145 family)